MSAGVNLIARADRAAVPFKPDPEGARVVMPCSKYTLEGECTVKRVRRIFFGADAWDRGADHTQEWIRAAGDLGKKFSF